MMKKRNTFLCLGLFMVSANMAQTNVSCLLVMPCTNSWSLAYASLVDRLASGEQYNDVRASLMTNASFSAAETLPFCFPMGIITNNISMATVAIDSATSATLLVNSLVASSAIQESEIVGYASYSTNCLSQILTLPNPECHPARPPLFPEYMIGPQDSDFVAQQKQQAKELAIRNWAISYTNQFQMVQFRKSVKSALYYYNWIIQRRSRFQ